MVDAGSLIGFLWRPEIVWRTGEFNLRVAGVLFLISLVFAIGMIFFIGAPGRRMFAAVAMVPVFVAWVLLFPIFIGVAGIDIPGGAWLLSAVAAIVLANLPQILLFLILWGVFELVVMRGLMAVFSMILHHPLEAHVDAWVVAPLIEEYAFRWVLMGLLIGWGGSLELAILAQGLIFAVSHVKNGLVHGLDSWIGIVSANIVVPFGFLLGFVAVSYGLVYAIVLHIIFNVIFDMMSILTGGKIG